ncbi:MAG: hypothetical protein MI924_12985, partial [Chloroflexales bacterium]|nr:hypothetical protein [Chloroflexales bacterium]
VEPTNVARFFREQKRDGDFTHLWRESPAGHYSINSLGRDKLMSLLPISSKDSPTNLKNKQAHG